jgi:hypothetical protein
MRQRKRISKGRCERVRWFNQRSEAHPSGKLLVSRYRYRLAPSGGSNGPATDSAGQIGRNKENGWLGRSTQRSKWEMPLKCWWQQNLLYLAFRL